MKDGKIVKFKGDVCPHQISFLLDNPLRRLLFSPKKRLAKYLEIGNVVVDLGCGPGFFTTEMAKIVGESGKVYAIDIQPQMLRRVAKKAQTLGLEEIIQTHQASEMGIGLDIKADFVWASHVIHEVPDQEKTFAQIKLILKESGGLFIMEPCFHVSQNNFKHSLDVASRCGFQLVEKNERRRTAYLRVSKVSV